MKSSYTIALAGNPNCGKTSIFNQLTGTRQHVGNYPGVTVESKTGHFKLNGIDINLIDLPGIYSLSSSSPEEAVVFRELTTEGIDLILNVIDSSIPQRSFYLTTQLAELHIPMLIAFNMSDESEARGLRFDIPRLEEYFGSPIVRTIGSRGSGVSELRKAIWNSLENLETHRMPKLVYGADIEDAIGEVGKRLDTLDLARFDHIPSRFFAIKLLEKDSSALAIREFQPAMEEVEKQIAHLYRKHAITADTFMADCRYAMIAGACRETIRLSGEHRREISDKIDGVVTNKVLGLPLFFGIMYLVFWFTFTCAEPPMEWIETGFGLLADSLKASWPGETAPFLRTLVTEGIIGGVGGVIVFLPNILFLFLAIAFLEDSGYMARAAFVMDGIMRRFGLHGKSFVPLVLGFGCTVPAVMATRSIESTKDRTTTILVLPLMSCGARLPIYALVIPAFFIAKYQAFIMWLIYLIGVLIALIGAKLMKSTLFKGDNEVYLMELPPYRMPTAKSIFLHMWDRGAMYLKKAGTIILGTSIILFIFNSFPQKHELSKDYDGLIDKTKAGLALNPEQLALLTALGTLPADKAAELRSGGLLSGEEIAAMRGKAIIPRQVAAIDAAEQLTEAVLTLENEKRAEIFAYTLSGRIGKALENVFRPIGFDWKISTALVGALAAKEVFVSQLAILYAVGDADEHSMPLREHLVRNYTPLQGFCIMLFCLLSIPCLATVAVVRRELNSTKMALAQAGGLLLLAYTLTFITYQVGSLLNIGTRLLS